ncbi:MAG TPA: urease accessory UreF family protein [Tepidisphaeraceae bacterium]|jgi:urease accessory protein|nr:urease accessory UreF family protein [Tepidisphaeraceae bacterium]
MPSPWLIWQLIDSAFPAGGLSHSAGLEAAWQAGEVGQDVRAFVRTHVAQQGLAMGPWVLAAHREPTAFATLDRACDAMLTNHVANRASRSQGRAMLSAVGRVFGAKSFVPLVANTAAVDQPAHQAPVFGAIGAGLGVADEVIARAFLFVSMRSVISAAVRVGIVGPFEGQTIQHELADHLEAVAQGVIRRPTDAACHTAPVLEVTGAMQDRLYSRLFVS